MNKFIWLLLFVFFVSKQACFAVASDDGGNKALQVPGSSTEKDIPIKIMYEDFKTVIVNNEKQLKLTVMVINKNQSQTILEALTAVKVFEQHAKQEASEYNCEPGGTVCHYDFIGKLSDPFRILTSQSYIEVQYKDISTGNRNVYKARPWPPLVPTSALEFDFSQGSQNVTVRNIYPDTFKLLNIEILDEIDNLKTECRSIKCNANCTFVIPQSNNVEILKRTFIIHGLINGEHIDIPLELQNNQSTSQPILAIAEGSIPANNTSPTPIVLSELSGINKNNNNTEANITAINNPAPIDDSIDITTNHPAPLAKSSNSGIYYYVIAGVGAAVTAVAIIVRMARVGTAAPTKTLPLIGIIGGVVSSYYTRVPIEALDYQ